MRINPAQVMSMQSARDINLINDDPMVVIELERDCQRRICDDLEQLADQLGNLMDIKLCTVLKLQLENDLPLYHLDEEAFFELLREKEPDNQSLAACTRQAVSQHAAMQTYTFELQEPLDDLCLGILPKNPDTLGYMLRYCFDSMRHHLNWEDASIFHMHAHDFSIVDLQHLRLNMIRNRT